MRQLEGIGRNLPGVLQMRAAAQVLPVAVPIHPQVLAFGDAVDQLQLEGFAAAPVVFHGRRARPDFGLHRVAGVDDLLHLRFDRAKIFGRERLGPVKVVKPAVVAHRADGDLHIRPDFLHRAGHDMRAGRGGSVPAPGRHPSWCSGDRRIGSDRPLQIPVLAVDLRRNRRLGQRGRNRRRHFGRRHARSIAALCCHREMSGKSGPWSASSSFWRLRNARLRVMSAGLSCQAASRRSQAMRGSSPAGCGLPHLAMPAPAILAGMTNLSDHPARPPHRL